MDVAETPPPAGAFGGITPDQMRANTREGQTDSVLREIHEGYKGNPIPPVPAAKKPPVPLIIVVSAAVIAAAVFFLGRDDRTTTTSNTSTTGQTQQTDAGQSNASRVLWSTEDGLLVENVKNELYKLCGSYRYYNCYFFDGKSGFIEALGQDWEWLYDVNEVFIAAEEFESQTGRMVNVYGIDSSNASLVQFSNTQAGNRDSRDKSELDGWIVGFELSALIQD
jgi:hypothetical protein